MRQYTRWVECGDIISPHAFLQVIDSKHVLYSGHWPSGRQSKSTEPADRYFKYCICCYRSHSSLQPVNYTLACLGVRFWVGGHSEVMNVVNSWWSSSKVGAHEKLSQKWLHHICIFLKLIAHSTLYKCAILLVRTFLPPTPFVFILKTMI
jgi:hypothetical protein